MVIARQIGIVKVARQLRPMIVKLVERVTHIALGQDHLFGPIVDRIQLGPHLRPNRPAG